MRFIFHTTNLDQYLYKRLIRSYIGSQYGRLARLKFVTKNLLYTITIKPSSMANESPFFDGKNGVGGVTDPKRMILYLEDKQENPKDRVQRVLRQNVNVITHEFGHKFLMDAGLGHKVPLRNQDEMGHKPGTMLNFWTAEVHDRDIENRAYQKEFWFTIRSTGESYRYVLKVLDFRDLL